jgi:hypothetical protein
LAEIARRAGAEGKPRRRSPFCDTEEIDRLARFVHCAFYQMKVWPERGKASPGGAWRQTSRTDRMIDRHREETSNERS